MRSSSTWFTFRGWPGVFEACLEVLFAIASGLGITAPWLLGGRVLAGFWPLRGVRTFDFPPCCESRVGRRPPVAVLERLHTALRDAPFLPVELVSAWEVPALHPCAHGRRLLPEQFREVSDR